MAQGQGFEAFYAASYRRVVGQVFALLGDLHEAEDVAQDAFAKASFHWARIAAYDRPEAWARRVAFNQAYNSTRRARRWLAAVARHGPPADAPAASADRLDLHHARGGSALATVRCGSCTTWPSSRLRRWRPSCGCRPAPSRAVSTVPGPRSPNSSATSARGPNA